MQRMSYPPPIKFDNLRFIIQLDSQKLTLDIPLKNFEYLQKDPKDKFDVIPLNQVARIIQKQIVLI